MSVTKPFVNLIALRKLPNTKNGTLLIHKDPAKEGKKLLSTSCKTFRWKFSYFKSRCYPKIKDLASRPFASIKPKEDWILST